MTIKRRRGLLDQRTAPYQVATGWGHTPALYRYPLDLVRYRVVLALLAGLAIGAVEEAVGPPSFETPSIQQLEHRV